MLRIEVQSVEGYFDYVRELNKYNRHFLLALGAIFCWDCGMKGINISFVEEVLLYLDSFYVYINYEHVYIILPVMKFFC
jgi:hypothetical protein